MGIIERSRHLPFTCTPCLQPVSPLPVLACPHTLLFSRVGVLPQKPFPRRQGTLPHAASSPKPRLRAQDDFSFQAASLRLPPTVGFNSPRSISHLPTNCHLPNTTIPKFRYFRKLGQPPSPALPFPSRHGSSWALWRSLPPPGRLPPPPPRLRRAGPGQAAPTDPRDPAGTARGGIWDRDWDRDGD